ncbi:MAG: phosphatidylinositol transfer protein, partial [Sandaracinus sp.]|nr:phosphatidylinositol transfer protein [Sandaracinus sp.]
DATAYVEASIVAEHRLLYQLDGDAMGGVIFDDYRDLVAGFEAMPLVCE